MRGAAKWLCLRWRLLFADTDAKRAAVRRSVGARFAKRKPRKAKA